MTDVWADVVGQERAVATLRAAAADPAAMTHAWLITGPPGSGRSNAARAFAAALQCAGTDLTADSREAAAVLGDTHPDVKIVATQKVTITIDEVRSLINLAQTSPARGRWRVIIIEDADRMAERTSNVLLKAIEEPPPRTVWLLCAPSPQDVVVTIRSRCRPVALRIPSVEAIAELLARRDGIDYEVGLAAARAAQSHVGLARRLARDPEARQRRTEVLSIAERIRGVGDAVLAAAKVVEVAQTEATATSVERDAAEKAELLRNLGAEDGKPLPPSLRSQVRGLEEDQKRRATRAQRDGLDRALIDLLSLFRDVLVVQLGAEVDLVNTDLDEVVQRLAQGSDPRQTLNRLDAIGQARTRLAGNVAPLLAIEAMMIALRPQA